MSNVFLNGKFVPEDEAVISVFDRGFLYGDGLFETIYVTQGNPFRWKAHMERFRHGQELMNLKCPYSAEELLGFVEGLIRQNQMSEALLRLTVSRGKGPRGYSPTGANEPTVVISLHPAPPIQGNGPPEWKLVTSPFRLPANEPLASFKTCNKLPQILARAAADAQGAQEGLLLNTDNAIVEGASSNLFWVQNGVLGTPPLASGILPGVTRAVVIELADQLGLPFQESSVRQAELGKTDGVFLSLSSVGIAAGISLDGEPLPRCDLTGKLYQAYWALVGSESSKIQLDSETSPTYIARSF